MIYPKQHRSSKELREELRHIYAERDGNIPDLTKLDRRNESRVTRILIRAILVLFVLSLASWGGFFLWSKGMFIEGKPLLASIDAPMKIRSGEPMEYAIRYQNVGRVPLASLEFKLNAPPSFHLISADPPPTEGTSWTIGSLTEGSDGAVIVKGIFLSEVPSTSALQAFFTYRPANFSSDFQEILTSQAVISDSIITSAVTGPGQAAVGDETTYTINIQNVSQAPAEHLKCQVVLPQDFVTTSVIPAPSAQDILSWTIPPLKANGIAVFTIKGRYTVAASGEQSVTAKAGIMDKDAFLLQTQSNAKTDVKGGNISFRVTANGADAAQTANLGDTINASISYGNNGDDTVQDLSLFLQLDPPDQKTLPVEWDLKTLGNGTRKNNTITWDKTSIPALAVLLPKAAGTIDFQFPIHSTIKEGMADQFSVKLSATYSQSVIGAKLTKRTVTTSPFTISVNSNIDAKASVSGIGPLPPKVGQTTAYRIHWDIKSGLHSLRDLSFSTNLPPEVKWTEKTTASAGRITFDPATRLVVWAMDELEKDKIAADASFEVSVTPQKKEIGSFLKLTNATLVEATDDETSSRLSKGIDILTTELSGQDIVPKKGAVAP